MHRRWTGRDDDWCRGSLRGGSCRDGCRNAGWSERGRLFRDRRRDRRFGDDRVVRENASSERTQLGDAVGHAQRLGDQRTGFQGIHFNHQAKGMLTANFIPADKAHRKPPRNIQLTKRRIYARDVTTPCRINGEGGSTIFSSSRARRRNTVGDDYKLTEPGRRVKRVAGKILKFLKVAAVPRFTKNEAELGEPAPT